MNPLLLMLGPMSTEPNTDTRTEPEPGPAAAMHRTIKRPFHGRMITGAASGIAAYLDLDPTIVRVIFVAILLFGGAGVPLYLAAWLLIPDEGSEQSIAIDLLEHAKALFGPPSHAGDWR
jgi:phage shock protein PspC (stress-responsive transcriptional regulator)